MKPFVLATIVLVISMLSHRAIADEWGCEVLLCAASSNPSWHGVPECHPPMQRLISAMKKPGFSWPTCPEGGAGKPGYEPFADCPPGWTETDGEDAGDGYFRATRSRCMRPSGDCQRGNFQASGGANEGTRDALSRLHSGGHGCDYARYIARPRRPQPYYFDIREQNSGTSSRYYFDLR